MHYLLCTERSREQGASESQNSLNTFHTRLVIIFRLPLCCATESRSRCLEDPRTKSGAPQRIASCERFPHMHTPMCLCRKCNIYLGLYPRALSLFVPVYKQATL